MDMGKYVAVGVLAVIVLAAATYDKPQTKEAQQAAAQEAGAETEPVYAIDYEQIQEPAAIAPESSATTPVESEAPQLAAGAQPSALETLAQASKALEYTVKKGQTLSDVAGELLGDRGKWRQLYEQNKDRLPSPDQIRAGMKLVYEQVEANQSKPASASRTPAATALPASAPRSDQGGYRVAKGDTLYSIAKKELGSGGRWKEIASLNGLDNGQVKVGQRLKMPSK